MKIITRPFVEQAVVTLPVIHIVLCPVCHANVRIVPNALSLDKGFPHAVLGPISGDSLSFPLLCPNGHKLVTRFCNMHTPDCETGKPVDQTVLFVDQVLNDTDYDKAVEEIKKHQVDMAKAAAAAGATPLEGAPGFKVVKGVENVNKFLKSLGVKNESDNVLKSLKGIPLTEPSTCMKDCIKEPKDLHPNTSSIDCECEHCLEMNLFGKCPVCGGSEDNKGTSVPIKPLKIEESDNESCDCSDKNTFDYDCDCQHCTSMKMNGACSDCGGEMDLSCAGHKYPDVPKSGPQRVQLGFAITEEIMDFYCRQIASMKIHKKAFAEGVDKHIYREWILQRAHQITEMRTADIEKIATTRFKEMLKHNSLNYSMDDLPFLIEEEIATAVQSNADGIRLRLKDEGIWPLPKSKK